MTLRAAYGDGLLSERTFSHRLDLLFGSSFIDADRLIGDLTLRPRHRPLATAVRAALETVRSLADLARPPDTPPAAVLALDWGGGQDELVVGRHDSCDIVVDDMTVSRRHAQLRFRDGAWVVRDLDSTNGTTVNGQRVVRCRLEAGDLLTLGDAALVVD